ncbi:MAG: HXXEE domain-containing protein [Pseudoclavibacter sp.]|nr:HXXEE domain-containing protein [Pseudoclavibacter sp.]
MTVQSALWVVLLLYAVHELEEIAMIRPWAQRVQLRPARDPEVQRRRERDTFARRYRRIRGEAAAILVQTLLLGVLLAFADASGSAETACALFAVHGLHLFGHLGMAVRARAYTPGLLTAIGTLPLVSAAAAGLWLRHGPDPRGVAACSAGIALLVLAELAVLRRLEGRLARLLDRYAGGASPTAGAPGSGGPAAGGEERA